MPSLEPVDTAILHGLGNSTSTGAVSAGTSLGELPGELKELGGRPRPLGKSETWKEPGALPSKRKDPNPSNDAIRRHRSKGHRSHGAQRRNPTGFTAPCGISSGSPDNRTISNDSPNDSDLSSSGRSTSPEDHKRRKRGNMGGRAENIIHLYLVRPDPIDHFENSYVKACVILDLNSPVVRRVMLVWEHTVSPVTSSAL